jgi:hypothetical protein
MYYLCFIFQVGKNPVIENSYPYREVLLTRSNLSSPLSFPVFNGEFNTETLKFVGRDELVEKIFSTYADSVEFLQIKNDIIIYLIKNKSHSILFTDRSDLNPLLISSIPDGKPIYTFPIMDEILQGRYCHVPISRVVRNLFFSNDGASGIKPDIPYLYDSLPETELYPTNFALVPFDDSDSKEYPIHNSSSTSYIRIPLIGYHGTSSFFIPSIFNPDIGLAPTLEKGMYGNNAYYFGNFWKAIRYAFRDSQYSTISLNGPLLTDSRPAGFIEMPNTSHLSRESKEVSDIIRDSPALVRFVIFLRNSSFLPRDLPKIVKADIKILRSIPELVDNRKSFMLYSNTFSPESSLKTFSDDYIDSIVGKPLFTPEDSVDSFGVTMDDTESLIPMPDSNRQEVVLKLYKSIHIASQELEPDSSVYAILLFKMPGELPDLAGFSLMTSGFLTDGKPINGSTITYIPEEKIRMMLPDYGIIRKDETDDVKRVIESIPTLEQTSHRLVMEDLARLSPRRSHILMELYSLPPELVEQISNIFIEGGRKLIIIRAINELQVLKTASQPIIPDKEEITDIQTIIDTNVANLEELGAKVHILTFTPNPSRFEGGTIRIKNKMCDIMMEESIETTKDGKRIFSRSSGKMAEEYVAEYPRTGGSMRVYPWSPSSLEPGTGTGTGTGDDKFSLESILPERWKSGETESLIVEPFRISTGKRSDIDGFNITSHTEIISRTPKSFIPLSWHIGDMRNLSRHHITMSVTARVL